MRLLKVLVIAVLVLNSLGSALIYPVVYLDFSLRRDYIAKVLCINRQKPMTVCGGQCYLADQLKKVREQQENEEERMISNTQFVFFYQPLEVLTFASFEDAEDDSKSELTDDRTPVRFVAAIFHPPQLV
jgi:hypothetical protein